MGYIMRDAWPLQPVTERERLLWYMAAFEEAITVIGEQAKEIELWKQIDVRIVRSIL